MSPAPVTNLQPTLTMAEYIDWLGVYPPAGGGGEAPFIGEIDISAAEPSLFGLLAEGQTLPINSYSALFSLLGTQYGGNGDQTFNLPNLSGGELIGEGQGAGLDAYFVGETTGASTNTISATNVPASLGGLGQPITNYQPSTAVTYAINALGIYPSSNLSSATIGVITAFAENFAPGDELACDGQLLPINEYEALFNVIGTTYGGNGVTNFALPDLRGRDIVGAGNGFTLGQDIGSPTDTLTTANLPSGGATPINVTQPGLVLNYYIATEGVFPSNPVNQGSPDFGTPYLGQIFAFAGTLPDPTGCLLCDGQLLPIQQYQALFALLGTTYGGDGIRTFALPNLQGRSILGVGAANPEGQVEGSATTTLTYADFSPPTIGSLTATTTEAVQDGAGVLTLASAPTGLTAPMTNGDLQSLTVTIANPQAGDVLGVGGNFALSSTATQFTTGNGGDFLATYSNDVLTITNYSGALNSVAQFEAAMALVGYQDDGSDPTTGAHPSRTLIWTVNDGIQNSPSVATTVAIDRAPVLTPDTLTVSLTVGAPTTATPAQGVLSPAFASDSDGDPLTVVAVNGAAANVGAPVVGADGALTLNADGSFSYQLTGLSAPSDAFTYTVSDGQGGTATQTLTFDAPTTVAPTILVAAPAVHSAILTTPVNPFGGDAVNDGNGASLTETLTVTPSAAGDGVLSDPNAATDGSSIDPTTGAFSIAGTAAQLTTALDGLVYTPNAGTVGDTTTFTITDISPVYPLAITDSTTQVIDTPCYARGVRILTERGEVAVENLSIGELVVTASGARRPIRWIGHRKVDCRRHPQPHKVWPFRVRAGAFGEGAPHRDLWLSPGHSVASEGALIPIAWLANGVSVAQVECAEIEYWHVELDAHDVILAEGLPAESYLDTGNRIAFVNGGAFVEAHPDFQPKHWAETCLPLVKQGPAVVATKARLLARLRERGWSIDQDTDAHILVDGRRVEPMPLSETRLAFALPPGGREIALGSKTFVPAHTVAGSADPRELGLCVGGLQIDGCGVALEALQSGARGWHGAEYRGERFALRWTTGATPLPAGARIVILDLAGDGHYWRAPQGAVDLSARDGARAVPSL
jgi:microcystin-dependent protein